MVFSMAEYRSPIVVVLGHIDHGKTSLLDRIRQTRIAEGEAGGITQSIGSTFIPMETITKLCKPMFDRFGITPTLSGLLFIDTPGHEAFVSMRRRGSHMADMAILLVDINEGIMPQTVESIQIIKETKTPFVFALNKIDKLYGWQNNSQLFLENFKSQHPNVQSEFEKRFYEVVSDLEKHSFRSDRFDRVQDFSRQVAAVPISAKTGEGIAELLFVLTGLAEKFIKPSLDKTENCRGFVLEVKETKGLGMTADAIVCDGSIRRGDYLAIGGKEPITTKIKALLVPRPLQDIRAEKKFDYIESADASCGVRIFASGLENAVPGSEFAVFKTIEEAENAAKEMKVEAETGKVEREGLILKADTLGGLEALKMIFRDFEIKYADVGQVNRNDVIGAELNPNPLLRAIICFNMNITPEVENEAKSRGVRIFCSPVIYHLIEEYSKWKSAKQMEIEMEKLKGITLPGKFRVLPGCIFRASKPAIIGCEVMAGIVKPEYRVFRQDSTTGEITELGIIKQIQSEGSNVAEAKAGEKVAVSITDVVFGRNLKENDVVYTMLTKNDFSVLKQFEKILPSDQKQVLEEIGNILNIN